MGHIQSKPAHHSEAQPTKDVQADDRTKITDGKNHRLPQKEEGRVDNNIRRRSNEESSRGIEITGFPWQLVVLMGVIICGVLAIALKAIGLI